MVLDWLLNTSKLISKLHSLLAGILLYIPIFSTICHTRTCSQYFDWQPTKNKTCNFGSHEKNLLAFNPIHVGRRFPGIVVLSSCFWVSSSFWVPSVILTAIFWCMGCWSVVSLDDSSDDASNFLLFSSTASLSNAQTWLCKSCNACS